MSGTDKRHPRKAARSTLIGILANTLLAAGKGVAGVAGNSYALVADAIESVSDVFTSLIVYLGIRVAVKKPSKKFPYGHGKAEPIAGTIVAIMLITAGVVITVNSISNITTPHEVPEPYTLAVLVIVILVKELLFRFVIKVGKETESTAVVADAWHHRSDAITSATAFIGISVALIGGPGYESADDWAALAASALIIYNAYHILRPSLKEIMDAAPPERVINEILAIAKKVKGVKDLDKCLVRKVGFEYFVELHVVVDPEISVKQGHDIAHDVKDEICEKKTKVADVVVHVEPYNPGFQE